MKGEEFHTTDLVEKEGRKFYHPRVYVYATQLICSNKDISPKKAASLIRYYKKMNVSPSTISSWKKRIRQGEQIISDKELENAASAYISEDPKLSTGWYRGGNHLKGGFVNGLKQFFTK